MTACVEPDGGNGTEDPDECTHSAFFYRGDRQYLDVVLTFVFDGLRNGEPALVAVPTRKLSLLRDAFGELPAEVTLADMAVVGRNPARIIGLEAAFLAEHPGRPVRMVGEVMWPERTDDEYPDCVKHEALVNTAFAERSMAGLCPYDAANLAEEVLADARTTHPLLWGDGTAHRSADYAPDGALARYNQPLPGDATAAAYTVREFADLSPARSFAARYAHWLGLSSDAIADLQLIATELATNSLEHAGGSCRLAFWRRSRHVVCEASDGGRLRDPLAGRRLPPRDASAGRGLFLVNSIADLVRTHTTCNSTTIQAYLALGSPQTAAT